ncbi:TRAP-type C4-dicarboxylate transport system, substrate-binding protein [Halopseudomonas sabulinigri]|uniref:TRAP-type C4-dicarboxylate transport system, substrate-binding protein n=1 Tax=Halopseudomonas sabulinigri TaxID=472181 RepID=A0A1H1LC98_9GAMM|nr:TRAP transporter substrate-binding protein DctP [Halopseudomonas sabulinigri]SDR71932.1 TRAP-type C4-dicarboxylate transport system, substrate-binding protein [Halopseudomonas sabulinigri]
MNWRNGCIGAAAVLLAACGSDEEPTAETAAPEAEAEQTTAAAEPETWGFALEEIEGSVQYEYGAKFAELVKEKTDGEVEVKLYTYGQLGGLTDIYDQVQSGAVQFAFGSGFLGGTVPESQLFSLNFVLTDNEKTNAEILNAPEFRKNEDLVASFRERDLQPLAIVPEGWQVWSANKEVRSPEDFDGMAIRTMDNRLLRETYSAYGADPTTMEYGELFSGMQLGQLDGNIQPVFAHQEMDFYKVQDYLIFANQAEFIATFMANSPWYDGLSQERKDVIEEAVTELVPYIHDVQTRLNTERLDIITENSDIELVYLTPEQREVFRERSLPVREVFSEMVGERGTRLMNALLEQVEKADVDKSAAAAEPAAAEPADEQSEAEEPAMDEAA